MIAATAPRLEAFESAEVSSCEEEQADSSYDAVEALVEGLLLTGMSLEDMKRHFATCIAKRTGSS